jgi:predicted PhzF superfamily epimerase YddE/YHI9
MNSKNVSKQNVARQIYEARVFFSNKKSNNKLSNQNNSVRSKSDGNTARCFIFYNEPTTATMLAYSNATQDTCCFTWNSDNAIQVRCYRRGQYITFCGHGLLACANLWKQLTAVPSTTIEEVTLRTRDQEYSAVWRDGKVWLRAPRIYCEKTELPDDIEQWFDVTPERSALAGDGYRIFEFSRGVDIANIRVNIERLASEDRAIIVTQALVDSQTTQEGDLDSKPWSYQLRYFAPKFGIEEDSATGSANAVLADYWTKAGLKPPFHVHQCSSGGGELFGDVDRDDAHVLISGNVVVFAKGEPYASFRG